MSGDVPWQVLAVGDGVPEEITPDGLVLGGRALRVHRVGSLLEAREVLKTARPSCVLVSESLPDGDPMTLVSEWSEIPFIVLGGAANEGSADRALEAGAQDYLDQDELAPRSWSERFATPSNESSTNVDCSSSNIETAYPVSGVWLRAWPTTSITRWPSWPRT